MIPVISVEKLSKVYRPVTNQIISPNGVDCYLIQKATW